MLKSKLNKSFHVKMRKYYEFDEEVTWDIVKANPEYWWNTNYLSQNPNITWDIVKANPHKVWDRTLGMNPNITWKIIQENPTFGWYPDYVSLNPNITWKIVMNNPHYGWYPDNLARNPNITLEIIKNNKWFFDYDAQYNYSYNPNVTPELVKANPAHKWDFFALQRNKNFTLDDIKALNCKLDYQSLNMNPNITIDIIMKDSKFYNSWISYNCNINWGFIYQDKEQMCMKYQSGTNIPQIRARNKKRAEDRMKILKEELIATALNPKYTNKWIQGGMYDMFD